MVGLPNLLYTNKRTLLARGVKLPKKFVSNVSRKICLKSVQLTVTIRLKKKFYSLYTMRRCLPNPYLSLAIQVHTAFNLLHLQDLREDEVLIKLIHLLQCVFFFSFLSIFILLRVKATVALYLGRIRTLHVSNQVFQVIRFLLEILSK